MPDDITMLDPDDSRFQTLLSQLPYRIEAAKQMWVEDELLPITPEEEARLLRDAIAIAREKGWIEDA